MPESSETFIGVYLVPVVNADVELPTVAIDVPLNQRSSGGQGNEAEECSGKSLHYEEDISADCVQLLKLNEDLNISL